MKELRELGSCSRCGIALKKSESLHFVVIHKKVTWDFPAYQDKDLNLPWKEAYGVLCDGCFKKGERPYFAVELRGDTVFNYTMVELEDSFVPTTELLSFVRNNPPPFHHSIAPEQVKSAVNKFLQGIELPESELSVVRWYVWQWFTDKSKVPGFRESISFLDQNSFVSYINREVRGKAGLDPFS
jgi:hypothetical protein